jgi:hypothetical protein
MITLPHRSAASPPGDGLGYRVLGFDKKTGDRLEMLRVRQQFSGHAPFESALRDRLRRLAFFDDPAFARVRQIDRLAGSSPSLVIVSHHVLGVRLAEVLSVAESFDVRVDIGATLGLVRQLTAAIATLHAADDGISHGCIGPDRLLLMADGRLIVTEYILGTALEAMDWPREKYWYESRIALPASGESAAFDRQADIMQIGLLALALLEGRTVYAERRYPLPLAQHITSAREVPIEGPPRQVSPALIAWLTRALQRDLQHNSLPAFTTIDEALTALDQVIEGGRYDARQSTVAAFVTRCRQASPDLKPRDIDTAREAERMPHVPHLAAPALPAVHVPVPVSSAPTPIGGAATLAPGAGSSNGSPHAPSPSSLSSPSSPSSPSSVSSLSSASSLSSPSSSSSASSLSSASPQSSPSSLSSLSSLPTQTQTPATFASRASLYLATRAQLPTYGDIDGEPIEFVPAAGEEEMLFEHVDDTPVLEPAFADLPLEEMNSVLDMEVFVGMVHQQKRAFVVQVDRRALMLVDPLRRAYWLLTALAGVAPPEPPPIGEVVARLRSGSLRYRDGRANDPPPGAGFPIEQLLWNLGMVLQPDDLLPQVKARGWVQLTRWPDFGRIRSNHAQLKMSALLTNRSFNVDEVFDAVGEPRPDVIAFLNACALCGLLADAPVEAAPPSVGHLAREGRPLGGLMQRLRGALGIGRA